MRAFASLIACWALAALAGAGPLRSNHLIHEASPYLQQHAHNPVDWYPWGEEAFKKARDEDKPIFLSIGYSTCHWCHVMERESFEDEEVAALLDRDFVAIKVDREERPDVDQVYMTATQALTGSGGWPLTLVLTPDKQPFFAGTYFPKNARFGQPGLMDLLPRLAQAWHQDRAKVDESVRELTKALIEPVTDSAELGKADLDRAFKALQARFDPRYGGFGHAPKFPSPQELRFLLRYHRRTGDKAALQMVEQTLQAMRQGGVYDQVGFGFHRYSTDDQWLRPHFEKMLYDQALLAMAYTEAYQATRKAGYRQTAEEILAYVQRRLSSPEGAFYSAEDADSEGEEGRFYRWTPEQLRAAVGGQAESLPLDDGILHPAEPLPEDLRLKLFKAREARLHPFRDDKVLTDWNGLMISALARAAQAFQEPRYARAAQASADFVLARLTDKEGRLMKRYRGGQAGLPGVLDDYAFFIGGLIDLYEATFELRYLRDAIRLEGLMDRHFGDAKAGGYFDDADDGERLMSRPKDPDDGAIPSGNSVAALDLIRLARLTGKVAYERRAQRLMKAFSGAVRPLPAAHTHLLQALGFALGPSYEVVIAGRSGAKDVSAMAEALDQAELPDKVSLFRPDERAGAGALAGLAEFTASQGSLGGRATAYVCKNHSCKAPTTDIQEMLKELR